MYTNTRCITQKAGSKVVHLESDILAASPAVGAGTISFAPMPDAQWINIPAELRELPQWVCWRLETVKGRLTKVPYAPGGSRANTTDSSTWNKFDTVCRADPKSYTGIGFVFAEGGNYTGVDFDHHRDPTTGGLDDFARRYMERLNSYTEISQSGTGVHVIVRGKIPSDTGRKCQERGIEMYSSKRFFVMTGNHISGMPTTIESRQQDIEAMFAEMFPTKKSNQSSAENDHQSQFFTSDADLVERASSSQNGPKFLALWRGDFAAAGFPSQSEADAAFLAMLRFWTGGDKERSFNLFGQSGLNREKWERNDYREATWKLVDHGEVYSGKRPNQKRDSFQRASDDHRPKICLPGPNHLLSDFAATLAEVLRNKDIFYRNGEIVTLSDGDLKLMTPQRFRSWAENFFVGYRAKILGENSVEFNVTMSNSEAAGTLAAPQFTDLLRRVRRVNYARLPIIGNDGKLFLLPNGYHSETQSLTLADVSFAQDMTLDFAVEIITKLLVEFRFGDGDRSKAVAVGALVGLFVNQLLPEKSLRPCFIFVANAEGAGKTLLAQICITPTLGSMPTGSKSSDDDEMEKVLLTAVREARSVIFLDNIKGRLSSPSLEAFLSASTWGGRKLGVNESISGENHATVFCTGNGMTVSPDMRRRSLFVELHLEAERAEDRKFNRLLDLPTLLAFRPTILAALWAMVRHWDEKGRPRSSRGHSGFPAWADTVGGIIEAAGFVCPLETANVTAVADPDGEDMRELVSAMAQKSTPYTFGELVELARRNGLFESLIGGDSKELGRREKSTFGSLLGRYPSRLVSKYRFLVLGKGKNRRYKVEIGYGRHGTNGVSGEDSSPQSCEEELEDHADHADHAACVYCADTDSAEIVL